MMTHLFFALTNSADGHDDEFNEWYDRHHMREVVRNVPGFASGRRFSLDPLQRSGALAGDPSLWKYLAIYEIESDDLTATHAALARHSKEVGFTSDGGALDPHHVAWVYSPMARPVAGGTSLGDEEHVFLALTNAAEGREDDLNAWYDNHHVQEIVERMPGFMSGRRYVARPENQRPGQSPPWKYLALYELEGDIARIHEGDAAVRASGTLTQADGAFDRESLGIWIYTPLGPRVTKAGLEAAIA
jgi:hypothetical protein